MPKKQKGMKMPQQQPVKTKEQLLAEVAQKKEVVRLRAIVKEELYPTLCTSTQNIEEAKALLAIVSTTIKQKFNAALLEKKVSELNIIEILDKTSPKYEVYKKVMEILNNESISVATSMLEGMGQQIDSTIRKEMSTRGLTTINIELY